MRALLLMGLTLPAFAADPPDVLPAMRETCPMAREHFADGVTVSPMPVVLPTRPGSASSVFFVLTLVAQISRY